MIDALVSTLVGSFLVPYVKKGLEAIVEKVREGAEDAVADEAKSLTEKVWKRVKTLFSKRSEDAAVLENFETHPDETASYVQLRLKQLLDADPEAAKELQDLLDQHKATVAVIGNSGVTVTVTNSTIDHGSVVGGVIYGDINPATER